MQPHVIIIGGGFGGLEAARRLKSAPVRITLVDRHNHHLFQPLLYQVATAALSPGDIASLIRSILRHQRNTQALLAGARSIDIQQHKVFPDQGELNRTPANRPFSVCSLATGFCLLATSIQQMFLWVR